MASNIPVIVQGNSFNLAIPLQIYIIDEGQMELQDYTPDPTDQISIQLKGSRRNYTYTPTDVTDNVCTIALGGYELADNYSVVVSIVKVNGQRLRSFRTDQFFIVESSDDLTQDDIIEGLEENVIYLNASIFVAGADGRGIVSILKTATAGLVDTYTITYTDATTSTFNVTNGVQGAPGATIESVEKTATAGKVDTYTITMTDGSTFTFQVTNGMDGVDLGLANIINDLTTGGATNVLSAEMGKKIGKELYGDSLNYVSGVCLKNNGTDIVKNGWCRQVDYTAVSNGDTIIFNAGATNNDACLCLYDSSKGFLGYYSCNAAPRTITLSTANVAYIRTSFALANKDEVYIKVNNDVVWRPQDTSNGLETKIGIIEDVLGVVMPNTPTPTDFVMAKGYINKYNGNITTSSINSYSNLIDLYGYESVQFVGNITNISDVSDCAAFYDANGTFLSYISYYDSSVSETSYHTYLVPIPQNARYFAFTLQSQFLGHAEVRLIRSSIQEELDEIMANAEKWIDGYQMYTNEGVGNVCSLATYASSSYRYFKAPCFAGAKVLITKGTGGNNPLWCFLSSSNVILSVADANASVDELYLTAPANTAWLICNDTEKSGEVFVYKNNTQPLDVNLELFEKHINERPARARVSNCKDFGTQPAANGSSGAFCNVTTGSYSDLLTAVYEPLRTAYPNYISRENIGKDASGTIDMYAYVFEPRYYQQSIYLQAGIHGKEVDAVACLARIMYLIANATSADEDLLYLRQNVKITVVPCVNVWGFSQSPKAYYNSDNASMQQWSATTPPAEISNIKSYITNKSLTDELSFMLDMHTTTNDTYYDFYGNIQRHARNVRTIFKTNSWLCDNYALDGRTVDDQYLGYYEPAGNQLFRQFYYYNYGVQTSTLELSDYHWDSALSTSTVITMGVTMWLNYIIQMANDYYKSMYDIPESDYHESRG